MRDTIRFLRSGKLVELTEFSNTETVLDYLRLREGATGTKEGCGEGDCGACTVAVGRPVGGRMVYRPVNSCICLLGMLDGAELVTVEDLMSDGRLHPVQQAMLDLHGSQCGFCTPGFIMSLFTLYHAENAERSRSTVTEWLAGNLCRCTGYRPIIQAALDSCFEVVDDAFSRREDETVRLLEDLDDGEDIFVGSVDRFFCSPSSIETLSALYSEYPDTTLVSGGTDVGLWITKGLRELPRVAWLGRVPGLNRVENTPGGLIIGAGATYSDCEEAIRELDPDLGLLWSRIGSKQVRSSGTVGGNIGNGSPIGDTPPALIALGTMIELQQGDNLRTIPLEEYFLDYGKQDRRSGEFITGLFVPRPDPNQIFHCYKLSKRFDQDISAVMAAFRFSVADQKITEARVAYGGMAGIPKRAEAVETALIGAVLGDPGSWSPALAALLSDFQPLSDMRASAKYRMETARALLVKALMEAGDTPARMRLDRERSGQDDRAA